MYRFISTSLALSLVFSAFPVQAHHSFAATFTDQEITVEGYVEKMSFTNPHVIIYFNVTDENGEQQQWMSEGSAATLLRNRGWNQASLVEGDYIRVTGNSTRNGSPMVSMGTINLIDPATGAIAGTPGQEATETVVADNSLPMVRPDGLPNLTGAWTNAIRNRRAGGPPPGSRPAGGPGWKRWPINAL